MQEPTYELIELFSGQGNVSLAFRQHGRNVCSFDQVLGGKAMDFCGTAGFALGTQQLHVIPLDYFSSTRLAVWVVMAAGLEFETIVENRSIIENYCMAAFNDSFPGVRGVNN